MTVSRLNKRELERLRLAIQDMSCRSKLFFMLRDELGFKGYWKNKPRGNPRKGFQARNSRRDI